MSERRLLTPVKEEEGEPCRAKPLKATSCGPTKRSPGLEFVNYRQGWPWGGWEGVTGHSGARVRKKSVLLRCKGGAPLQSWGSLREGV